jgi:hypothetical protein
MISLGSCQKDYSEDIADLQAQITANQNAITALNSAIASGKLIKTVATTSTGYTITFSDNTTISLNHGTNGTPGATGPAGATGFTPVIGIDAQGYWTVVTTQGGTPARILVAGQPVYAKFTTDQFGANAQGFITINGVATSVYVPIIAYNDVSKKLQITIKNTDGTFTTYNVAVNEDTFLSSDLVSVVSPIGETKVIIGYGRVGATNASVNTTAALATEGLAFAGKTLNAELRTGGSLPVILNPTEANLAGYTYEIIKSNGDVFKLQPSSITPGYSGAFAQFATAATNNGLYTLTFAPTLADILTVIGDHKELAVRFTKGDRKVVSGFQYTIRVAADVTTAFAPKATELVVPPHTIFLPIGTSLDILSRYDRTNVAPARTLNSADFFKSAIETDPATVNFDVSGLVQLSGTTVTTSAPTLETVTNLNDKKLSYFLKTFDWVGKYEKTNVDIVFYAALDTKVANIDLGSHTLSTTAKTKSVMLTSMYTALQAEGKTQLWSTKAKNVRVEFQKQTGSTWGALAGGIDYQFVDAADANIGALNTPVGLGNAGTIRKIVFTIEPTNTNITPGNYRAIFKFDDDRAYAAGKEFTITMPLVIANPTLPAGVAADMVHTSGLWSGNNLSVFGPTAGQLTNPVVYDLRGAYATSLTTNFANYAFVPKVAADVTAGLVTSSRDYLVQRAVAPLTYTTLYTAKEVYLRYYFFGNTSNFQDLETITVTAKSEIVEGKMETLTQVVGGVTVPKVLEITHGVSSPKNFKDFFVFKNYFGTDLAVFTNTPNARVAAVAITVAPEFSNLVVINVAGADFTIDTQTSPLAPITGTVIVPVKVEVSDKFGLKFTGTVNVTVKQP